MYGSGDIGAWLKWCVSERCCYFYGVSVSISWWLDGFIRNDGQWWSILSMIWGPFWKSSDSLVVKRNLYRLYRLGTLTY